MNQRLPLVIGISLGLLLAAGAPPTRAADALAACWARADTRVALGDCLAGVKNDVDAEATAVYQQVLARQAPLDEALGSSRASRALARAEMAFVLYRDLHCAVTELQAASGTGAGDFYTACWIDETRARIAALQALLPEPPAMTPAPLAGRSWFAVTIAGAAVLAGTEPTLSLDADGKIGGSGGCNRYFGNATIGGETLEIGPLGTTRRACPPPIGDQETRFLKALESARSFRVENNRLVLADAGGGVVLTFRAAD